MNKTYPGVAIRCGCSWRDEYGYPAGYGVKTRRHHQHAYCHHPIGTQVAPALLNILSKSTFTGEMEKLSS